MSAFIWRSNYIFTFDESEKCLAEVNEASLMMRGADGGDSQMYRVPSFGDDPFDNDDEVGLKRKFGLTVIFGIHKVSLT